MTKEPIRAGLVGLGKMGLVHSCILKVLPNVQLTALCEKSRMTRRFLKKVFDGVPIVDDVEKFADFDLDAVFVTTPIPSHFAVAKIIYLGEIAPHLFVEKTLANNYSQAKELCGLADSFGGINMVGYLRRFYVTFGKARDLLSENAIGEVSSFKAYAYSSDFLGAREGVAAPGSRGGVLRDLGCHAVDLALWFFGDLRVDSVKPISPSNCGCEDYVSFNSSNSHGLEGQFSVSWRVEHYRLPEVGFSIIGSRGKMVVNDDKLELQMSTGDSQTWFRHDLNDNVPFWLGLPEYYREDLHFADSVAEHRRAEPDFHAASKVDEIISQAEKRIGEE
jgi:predicted dehydrogenase